MFGTGSLKIFFGCDLAGSDKGNFVHRCTHVRGRPFLMICNGQSYFRELWSIFSLQFVSQNPSCIEPIYCHLGLTLLTALSSAHDRRTPLVLAPLDSFSCCPGGQSLLMAPESTGCVFLSKSSHFSQHGSLWLLLLFPLLVAVAKLLRTSIFG